MKVTMTAVIVRLMAISTLAVAGFPAVSSAADVTGTWNISASTTDPCDYSGQMTLEQTGNIFIGVASLSSDSSGFACRSYVDGPILSGSVSGLDVSFTFDEPHIFYRALTVTGTLTSDQITMSGQLSGDGLVFGMWSATRVLACGEGVSQAPEGCTAPAVAFVHTLALDPNTPRTLYAGTGRYFGYGGAIGGVLKSTDGGSTWSPSGRGLGLLSPVWVLAIDPTMPSTLFAGTRGSVSRTGGVYKSTDGGNSWGAVNTGLPSSETSVLALAIDPTTPGRLYAGTDSYGVFKSTDGGSTWRALNTGSVYVPALAIDPAAPGTIYAATAFVGVLKSTDGGETWGGYDYGHFMETTLFVLAIDPTTPSTVYAGGDAGLYKSTDRGSSFRSVDTGLPSPIEALVIDPTTTSRTLYAGTHAGVFAIQQVAGCTGDCDGDGMVTVNEVVTGVNIALETGSLDQCPSFDHSGDGRVNIDELVAAVNDAMNGCSDAVESIRLEHR